MNTDTAENPVKVTLDTNIIISAVGFGGKPRKVLNLILDKKIKAVTSSILLAELSDVTSKKFPKLADNFEIINKKIRRNFKLVSPKKSLEIVKDKPDNRVLEAAVEGNCEYIVTGDKELLTLKTYKGIKILTAEQFLKSIE